MLDSLASAVSIMISGQRLKHVPARVNSKQTRSAQIWASAVSNKQKRSAQIWVSAVSTEHCVASVVSLVSAVSQKKRTVSMVRLVSKSSSANTCAHDTAGMLGWVGFCWVLAFLGMFNI